jgi:lambda family phage tail tape measure protein
MALNLDAALKITASVAGENNIRRFQNSLQGLEGRIKNTSMAADLLVTGIKGLAAAAVTGGVLALAKSAIDLADDMRDLSQRTGVSVQTLGQFKVAAELSGSSIEGVAKGLNFLNKNMVAAATGGKDAAAAFQTIGVSTKDAQGNLRTADQVFLDVADRFATLRDGPEKAAIAMRIFGKAGADLIPILNLGSKEIQRFGLNITQDFADKADAFNDQLGLAGAQVTNLSIQIGSALLPVINGLLAGLSGAVTQIGKWIEGLQTAYKENAAFKTSIDVLIGALTALATVQVFSTFIAGAKAAILITGTLIKALKGLTAANLLAGAAGFLKSKPGLIAALVAGLGVGIDAAFNQGKIVSGITRGISGALDQAFGMFGAMVPAVPNIPTRPGGVLDVSGLDTGTAKKAKKAKEIQEITAEELQLSKLLNKAKIDGNTLQQAELEYGLTLLDIDKQKIGVRQRQKLEADAATKLFQTEIDYAKQLGSAIAQDFLKRQELQNNYNNTVEDLRIKAGLITGEELKRLEIDRELEAIMERMPGLADEQIAKLKQLIQASQDVKKSFKDTFSESLKQYYEQITNLGTQVADSVKGAFQGLEDQLTSFVTTGKASFADLARSILEDIARIAIRQAIIAPLLKGVGSIFGIKFADGGVFAQNGIQKFARGGIVNGPTMFPFAKGVGLMGEAGPEAIMPLRRGADGRLGVAASGGAGVNVTVNVDAGSSQVQGDGPNANQLGRVIGAAVQAEIVKQQRPGGLLATTR